MSVRALLYLVVATTCVVLPRAAGAAEPTAQQTAGAAIAHADNGERLFSQRKHQQALEAFEQAHALVASPTMLVRIGDCKRELGLLVEARTSFAEAAAWELPSPSPPPYRAAKKRAHSEIDKLDQRIASLEIVIRGANIADVAVTVDGQSVPTEELSKLRLNPGHHSVKAQASDAPPVTQDITLADGASERVVLSLDVTDSPPYLTWPPIAALAVGGAFLTVGIVAGAISFAKVNDLKKRCDAKNNCPAEDQPAADAAQSLATASNITLVIGALGTITGVVLLFVPLDGTDDASGAGTALGIGAGPDGITLTGSF